MKIVKLSLTTFKDLKEYLEFHEDDIAIGRNDFGDLRKLFIEIFDREPTDEDI